MGKGDTAIVHFWLNFWNLSRSSVFQTHGRFERPCRTRDDYRRINRYVLRFNSKSLSFRDDDTYLFCRCSCPCFFVAATARTVIICTSYIASRLAYTHNDVGNGSRRKCCFCFFNASRSRLFSLRYETRNEGDLLARTSRFRDSETKKL